MLVISRKTGEALVIGENIEIIISDISSDKVKLAIKAPEEIKIFRKELLETAAVNQEAEQTIKPEVINLLIQALKKK